MSNGDSFIDEVTEAVRREQLSGYLRRYGWIGVGLVVLIVGGAAWTEYSRAQARNAAQARGDAILAALDQTEPEARAAALGNIPHDGSATAVTAILTAANLHEAGDDAAAIATLDALAANGAVPSLYRDLAALQSLILSEGTLDPAMRRTSLEALATPGAPFRLLALEQIALADIAAGDRDAAIASLRSVVEDAATTAGMRDRVSALMVALGADPDALRATASDES